jgi:hypothetical protein
MENGGIKAGRGKGMSVTILAPVGTSICLNNGFKPEDYSENMFGLKCTINDQVNVNGYDIVKAFKARATKPPGKDNNPAEISSLYALCLKKKDIFRNQSIRVVLFHSPNEGKYCAEGVKEIIEDKFPSTTGLSCLCITWSVELKELINLDPLDADKFPQALNELAGMIIKEIRDYPRGHFYINITGGYKGLLPYLTMFGISMGNTVKIFYLFEDSTEIIELPVYPFAFDLFAWRDWRGLLLPFTDKFGLTPSQKGNLFNSLKDTRIGGLIEQRDDYPLNPVGEFICDLYDEHRGGALTEFGTGGLLLDGFKNNKYKEYLKICIPRWRHLSAGDHIPETVEHGRGHVQRLLELAQQLLIAAKIVLSDEQCFVFISSIWLHDLGHTGDYFIFEGENGIVQRRGDSACTGIFPVYGDPNAVRKYHNILTYELLKSDRGFLIPNESDLPDFAKLKRSIELVCLYHRRAMPVECGGDVDICHIAKGIRDFDNSEVIESFPLIAALLRFLDGTENQEERTGSPAYYEVMDWVLARQVKAMKKVRNECQESLKERLDKEIEFKDIQKGHFAKHRMIRHVFYAPEDDNCNFDSDGVYGAKSNNDNPLIAAYLVANNQIDGYDEDIVKKNIINELCDEFRRVQDLLPFRLAIVLLKNNCFGQYEKYQAVVRPENGKKAAEWVCCMKLIG